MSDESTPAPAPPPSDRRGGFNGLLAAAAVAALAVALATWFVSDHRIAALQRDVALLEQSQQQLGEKLNGAPAVSGEEASVGRTIDVSQAPARGNPNAVVTLVEFADYECPFCIRYFQQTMPLIDRNYIATGKVRYVFRDFPIDANHPQSIRAHEAARCALAQGKFWQLHPHLFSAPGTHTPAELDALAKQAGLNMPAFEACTTSGRTTASIRASVSLAEQLGATGTPWFFVGLRDLQADSVRILQPIGGAQPYAQFAAALDEALRQAGHG